MNKIRGVRWAVGLLALAAASGAFYIQFRHPISKEILQQYKFYILILPLIYLGLGISAGILFSQNEPKSRFRISPIAVWMLTILMGVSMVVILIGFYWTVLDPTKETIVFLDKGLGNDLYILLFGSFISARALVITTANRRQQQAVAA